MTRQRIAVWRHLMEEKEGVVVTTLDGLMDHLLPLAAFNNIVVGVALILNHQFVTSFGGAVGFSLGAGAGFVLLAAVLSDGIRRADHPAMPDAFRGLPSALLYMGILALALLGFSGQFSFI